MSGCVKAKIAVDSENNAIVRCGRVAGCIADSDGRAWVTREQSQSAVVV